MSRSCPTVALILSFMGLLAGPLAASPPATQPATRPADTQPASIFAPLDAERIVFVNDSSVGMKMDPLRHQLRLMMASLRPGQKFNLLFTEAGDPEVAFREPVAATTDHLKAADDFLTSFGGHGGTPDPLPALRAAFAQKPQVIFLLTVGDFPNDEAAIAEIRRLNADRKVKVCTIAFVDHGETYQKVLKQIAEENGGTFRFASEEDLSP